MLRKFFRQRIAGPFCGVLTLTAYFGTSVSTFKRLFEKYFNTTPLEYFKNMQIEESKKLLKSKKYSVAQVSRKLGFSSPTNFIRTFKQYTGTTPRQFPSR
ncbi:helix-turn-helix transcriptional regulator [Pseudopedobacter beijingensis]|uniref:Helix-turn-helix transcriptional regulator n=1 Tax=Pseudopedobacter beijingensis TaxID=1207056 RepID=A0ABW4ICB1_9SPHI